MSEYRNMSGLSYQPDSLKDTNEEVANQRYPEEHNNDWKLYQDFSGEWGFIHIQEFDPFELDFEISYSRLLELGLSLRSLLGEEVNLEKIKLFSYTWYNGTDCEFNY